MLKKLSSLVLILVLHSLLTHALVPKKILVRLQLERSEDKQRIQIWQHNPFLTKQAKEREIMYEPGVTKITSWEFLTDKPLGISIVLSDTIRYIMMLEPGTDITLSVSNEKLHVTGPGSEVFRAKYEDLVPQLLAVKIPKTKAGRPFNSIEDFNEWNRYLDKQKEIVNRVVEKYSKAFPSDIWDILKVTYLSGIESRRCERFQWLSQYRKKFQLEKSDIDKIYHSVIFKNQEWLLSYDKENPSLENYYRIVGITPLTEMMHPISDPQHANFYDSENAYERIKTQFRLIDSLTTGRLKEELTAYFFITRIGKSIDVANDLLPIAFSQITSPELKDLVKRELASNARSYASDRVTEFYFQGPSGDSVMRKHLAFKTLVFHVNDRHNPKPDLLFQAAVQEFKDNPEVVLAEISYGSSFEEWQKKNSNNFAQKNGVWYLYSPATKDHLDFIQNIYSELKSSTLIFYQYKQSQHNNALTSSRFRKALEKNGMDSVASMLEVIRNEARKYDGPYIRRIGDTTFVYKVTSSSLETDTLSGTGPSAIEVTTGPDTKPFLVKLHTVHPIPPTSYPMPEKALFLSDIEGNFDTFREFLITQNVIDSMYNWTFGKGHLVITGDVFDRGRKVTGCLWLIYTLENQARKAGGAVHYILGNHEVMNLTGNYTYVYPDYKRFAQGFGLDYKDLYDQNSILGKWLRSKNIMEIIGGNLVVHGGISSAINAQALSAAEINNRHRSFLAGAAVEPSDTVMQVLLSSKVSPYWYRGYYPGENSKPLSENVIDQTLQLYRVDKIITGHTIVENVASFYNGKVINTDTHHASGDSEGLLIENGNYYRVDINGIREKLP